MISARRALGDKPKADVEDVKKTRAELEKPIKVSFDTKSDSTTFMRASMRREADREVREARHLSAADIGAGKRGAGAR